MKGANPASGWIATTAMDGEWRGALARAQIGCESLAGVNRGVRGGRGGEGKRVVATEDGGESKHSTLSSQLGCTERLTGCANHLTGRTEQLTRRTDRL